MRSIRKQHGITLIEMLIALGISAVIIGGLAAGIYSIMNVTGRGNAAITALRDIQSASYWISNDAQMARRVSLDGVPSHGITLLWNDVLGNPHSSSFTLSGTELLRNYDSNLITVAWHVSSVEFTVVGDVLTFTVVSTPPGRWNLNRMITSKVNLRAFP